MIDDPQKMEIQIRYEGKYFLFTLTETSTDLPPNMSSSLKSSDFIGRDLTLRDTDRVSVRRGTGELPKPFFDSMMGTTDNDGFLTTQDLMKDDDEFPSVLPVQPNQLNAGVVTAG